MASQSAPDDPSYPRCHRHQDFPATDCCDLCDTRNWICSVTSYLYELNEQGLYSPNDACQHIAVDKEAGVLREAAVMLVRNTGETAALASDNSVAHDIELAPDGAEIEAQEQLDAEKSDWKQKGEDLKNALASSGSVFGFFAQAYFTNDASFRDGCFIKDPRTFELSFSDWVQTVQKLLGKITNEPSACRKKLAHMFALYVVLSTLDKLKT
ncbi:hypothetical protein LTR36_010449 [Oleoguttula mirabilis]|uniref:Uncharacterized protein n=1 Tax=Oleoguttula mirabilis TaxID=1507867 RepID=A0AAV9J456_9PEZI|nr:hypothetical protein LTR36_010449 [Oleoguttula mirabilis]